MPNGFTVGCYYFPNYHVDPRNEKVHGKGWTEWKLVKGALPRFPNHQQPKVPLWGYADESDPRVMEKEIDAAADHGIDYFIFDWYWYENGPFLHRCLDKGYLGAKNNARVKFCCMWANHDWIDIHPAKLGEAPRLLYPGKISAKTFEVMTDHLVNRYFKHPSCFTIDGCPYFSIYELSKLIESFGGVRETKQALDRFKKKAQAAGCPDIHLNAVIWGQPILPGEKTPADPIKLAEELGFQSITSYVWIHHVNLNQSPVTDYALVRDAYFAWWDQVLTKSSLPYFPNVTMGWDPSPRTDMADTWKPSGYPYMNIMGNNTPEAFRKALQLTRQKLEQGTSPKIFNINCWNEWTEGSYLEPDTVNKTAYLKAIRDSEIF
jgi:hypothetical protein